MIRVESVRKRYGASSEPVLKGVSLEVGGGKLAALLGRSGSGKTTLLRCLVGLERFDEGRIQIDGQAVAADLGHRENEAALKLLRARVGLVFQSFELFPHLTILENCVLAPVRVKRRARHESEATAMELLGQLGLADKAKHFPEQLSGGQKQRVAIARALAMEPAVLCYDEPTSALDPSLRGDVVQALKRVRERGLTQLVVTHDLHFAREATDEVFVMDAGCIVESGPTKELFANPKQEVTRRLIESAGLK